MKTNNERSLMITRDEAPLTPDAAPFEERPCPCLTRHSPKPETTEAHHPWPQYDQRRRFGGELREKQTVDICPTLHRNVHKSIDLQLKGIPHRLPNKYGRSLVEYALEKIRSEA